MQPWTCVSVRHARTAERATAKEERLLVHARLAGKEPSALSVSNSLIGGVRRKYDLSRVITTTPYIDLELQSHMWVSGESCDVVRGTTPLMYISIIT